MQTTIGEKIGLIFEKKNTKYLPDPRKEFYLDYDDI